MGDIFKIIKKILCVIGFFVLLIFIYMISILVEDVSVDKEQEAAVELRGQAPISSRNEAEISDDKYYPTVEEALKYSEIDEESYLRKMDHVVAVFQNERYCSIYYQVYKNEDEWWDIFANFKIKEIDGMKKYCHLESLVSDAVIERDHYYFDVDQDKIMRAQLKAMPLIQGVNIEPDETQFVWLTLKANRFKKGESIEGVRVEGRKPDGILEYEIHGEIWYLLYYKDLKSEDGGELEYTFSGEDTE